MRFTFILITKIFSISAIQGRSLVGRLVGLSSYRTSTIPLSIFLDLQTLWLICCHKGRMLRFKNLKVQCAQNTSGSNKYLQGAANP